MAHEVENMMYVGETPWHGLGRRLDVAPATVAEALKLAGLDWTVSLEQLQLADGTLVDRNAVVRDSDRSVLGVVGMDWEAVQNGKAFAPFEPFLANNIATIETAGSLRGGRRVWMLAKVSRPDSVIVAQADDRVAKYLLVAVGHDGTMSYRMGFSPTRVVCNNTLQVALRKGQRSQVRIFHLAGANKAIEQVTATLDEIDARFEEAADLFRALASVKIHTAAQLRAYIDAVYPPAKAAEVQTLAPAKKVEGFSDLLAGPAKIEGSTTTYTGRAPVLAEQEAVEEQTRLIHDQITALFEGGRGNTLSGVKGTAWAAYNAVTEHLTWHRGGAKNQDSRLENLWLSNSGPVARALPAAVDQFLAN